MRPLTLLSLYLVWMATSLAAGPWPREQGSVFTAVTGSYRYASATGQVENAGSFYAEYGLGGDYTLGVDATDDSASYTHALLFLRMPPRGQRLAFAPGIGLGAARVAGKWEPLLRASLTTGRGVSAPLPGWWTVTATLDHIQSVGDPTLKLDATWGLEVAPRWKTILDLETSWRRDAQRAVTLRGSLAWSMTPTQDLLIGLETKDTDARSTGLRAGIWRRF